MRLLKLSSVFVLTLFFITILIPEANARGRRSHTSFGFSVNVGGPGYVVAPAPVAVPPPCPVVVAGPRPPVVVTPAPIAAPMYPAYVAPAPYPYYYAPAPVVVERRPRMFVQPGFSYTYRRR